MAAKKSDQRLRWERYLRIQQRVQQRHQKFMYFKHDEPPMYGSYLKVHSNNGEDVHKAKSELMAIYMRTKVLLKSVGVELSPPEFKTTKPAGVTPYTTVAWRAMASKIVPVEAQRKLEIRRKRARRARLHV